jgi:hypothetical protein
MSRQYARLASAESDNVRRTNHLFRLCTLSMKLRCWHGYGNTGSVAVVTLIAGTDPAAAHVATALVDIPLNDATGIEPREYPRDGPQQYDTDRADNQPPDRSQSPCRVCQSAGTAYHQPVAHECF